MRLIWTFLGGVTNNRNSISANDSQLLLNNTATPVEHLKEGENLIKPLNGEVNTYFMPDNTTTHANNNTDNNDNNNNNNNNKDVKDSATVGLVGDKDGNSTVVGDRANLIRNLDFGNSFIISLANLAGEVSTECVAKKASIKYD